MTVNLLNDEEWRAARKKVITATECGAILGIHPFLTGNKVWKQKNNGKFIPNSYVIIGQLLEDTVIKITNYLTGGNYVLFEHPDGLKPFYTHDSCRLGATPDAYNENSLLECKTTKPYNQQRWATSPPVYYVLQLIVQMMCCEYEVGILSIMGTDLTQKDETLRIPISMFTVTRNKQLEELIFREVNRFWTTVEAGKMYKASKATALTAKLLLKTCCKPANPE